LRKEFQPSSSLKPSEGQFVKRAQKLPRNEAAFSSLLKN